MKRCLSSPLAVGRVKMVKFAAETSNIIVAFVFAFVFVFVFVFILWLQCPSPVMTLRQGLGQGEIPSIPFLETGDELLVSSHPNDPKTHFSSDIKYLLHLYFPFLSNCHCIL